MTDTTPNPFASDATVLAMEFHRNGSAGVPFTVSKIRDEETGKILIGITINEDTGYCNTMVIDAEKITEDRIGEKYPSCWRGSCYHDAVVKAKKNLRRAMSRNGSLGWRRQRASKGGDA
mgnify:FL=1